MSHSGDGSFASVGQGNFARDRDATIVKSGYGCLFE